MDKIYEDKIFINTKHVQDISKLVNFTHNPNLIPKQ